MATRDDNDDLAFDTPLPLYHEESHPLLFASPQLVPYDFDDSDRLTVCELPHKNRVNDSVWP
jgi:hypothetical protein